MRKSLMLLVVWAVCLCSSYGVYAGGAEEYRKAAERGDPSAQGNLGLCYLMGDGVGKDVAEAVKWIFKAAEQGDSEGEFMIGMCYAKGIGVSLDEAEGVKWWIKSATKGNVKAQYMLWNCYAFGVGVAKDKAESLKWYRKVMESNNEEIKKNAKGMIATFPGELPCD